MRVEITDVLDRDRRLVRFQSACGAALARLGGGLPAAPGVFDVELDIPDVAVEWVVANEGESAVIGEPDGRIRLVGRVVGVEPGDKVITLRVADSVVLVELEDVLPTEASDKWLSVLVREVQLFDMNL